MSEEPILKPVIWVGSSRKDLQEFPGLVQDHMGYALYLSAVWRKTPGSESIARFWRGGSTEVIKDYRGARFERCTHCDTLSAFMFCMLSRRSQRAGVRRRDGIWI